MADYFLDTSAFAKRYHPEVGTPAVMAIFAESGRTVRIFLEVQSVFAMKVRIGVNTRAQAGGLRARMLLDMAADEFEVFLFPRTTSAQPSACSGGTVSRVVCGPWMHFNSR